jgi:hypothetical protein
MFGIKQEATAGPVSDNRSAWERLPKEYRDLCAKIAGKTLSPQNKRVRLAADRILANRRLELAERQAAERVAYADRVKAGK